MSNKFINYREALEMILSLDNPDSEDLCNQKYILFKNKFFRNLSVSNGLIWTYTC